MPQNNVRPRWRKWLWCVPALVPLMWYAQCAYERHTFNRTIAHDRAVLIMEDLCKRHCAEYGIVIGTLKGPIEAKGNSDEQSKQFEFTWQAPNGVKLLIAVFDNGLLVYSDHWWLDDEADKQVVK